MTCGIPKSTFTGSPTLDNATWFNAAAFVGRDAIDAHNQKADGRDRKTRREIAADRRTARKLGKIYTRLMSAP